MKFWKWLKSLRGEIKFYRQKTDGELLDELRASAPVFYAYTVQCSKGHTLKIPYIPGTYPQWKPHKILTYTCVKCQEPITISTKDIYQIASSKAEL